ncbi:unnamed protein product [Urochloa humidicola]
MAASALAKVVLHGRSSRLLPAIGRRVPQLEGMLPKPGPPMANPAMGMGRLMHTGQWRNPALSSQGGGIIGTPRKMEQYCSKRSIFWRRDDYVPPPDHPVTAVAAAALVTSLVSLAFGLPTIYRSVNGLYRCYK